MNKYLLILVGLLLFLGAGAIIMQNQSPVPPVRAPGDIPVNQPVDTVPEPVSDDTELRQGKKLAKNYYEFTQADYDGLILNEQRIVLYFYANWCPTCATQEPVLVSAMNAGDSGDVIVLRVNYSDSDTDAAEKALADEFNITYQHTFIGINDWGNPVITLNGQQTPAELQELFLQLKNPQS